MLDQALFAFATPRQKEIMEAVNLHGGVRAASRAMGVHNSVISRCIKVAKSRAAAQGYSPDHDMTHVVPDGFRVRGVSTYYNREGKPTGQWVKSAVDHDRAEELARLTIEAMAESVAPTAPVSPPSHADSDLLCLYPMGDPHFGLHAYAAEAGEDFDLEIAEKLNKAAVDYLVSVAPPAGYAVLANLGDFFHADNDSGATPSSGNRLDVDSRHHKVLTVGVWTMVYLVQRLLEKHNVVKVYNVRGNHDPISAMVLSLSLKMFFKDNPRVEIVDSPAYFHYERFGENLIGLTHGDGPKRQDMPGIMASDVPAKWGLTKYRVVHHGHIHHDRVEDFPGATVESHRTLAASDAWHRKSGYRAPRDMKVITYHIEHGELSRSKVNVDRLRTG